MKQKKQLDPEIMKMLEKDAGDDNLEMASVKDLKTVNYVTEATLTGTIFTKQMILDELWDIYKMCKATTPVLDRDGTPTGYLEFESRSAIKCLELLGSEIDMFKRDKIKSTDPTEAHNESEEVKALATHLTNLMTKGSDRTNVIDITATRQENED